MLSYAVTNGKDQVEYRGFQRLSSVPGPKEARFIALVFDEGEPYLWWLENKVAAVAELRRYYAAQSPWVAGPTGIVPVHIMPYPETV